MTTRRTVVLHASTSRHEEWGGPKRYVRVMLHPDVEHLRVAAARYAGGDFSQAAGCFHPAPDRWRSVDGEWVMVTDPHWAGVLRLAVGHLGTEPVVHEVVHAAATIYRMDVRTIINLGNGCRDREETLAYMVGDLARSVVRALYAAGAYDAPIYAGA